MLTGTLPFPSDSAQESMIMRLTDRPKTLADMRPQVSWPSDVQQVMDKALERDVAQRYQTATEFVRDLYRAIERMPDVVAADAGTQLLQVPPTRVNPDASPPPPPTAVGRHAPAPAASDGRVASAPPAQAGPAVTQTAAPPKRTGMFVAVGGIAAAIVAAVILVPMLKGGPAKQNQPSTTTQPVAADTSTRVAGSTGQTVDPATQQASEKFGKDQPAAKGQGSDPAGGSRSSDGGANIETQLGDLLVASKVRAQGPSVLEKLSKLEPQVKSSREIYLATTLRANVLVTKLDSTGACNAYKNALSRLNADDVVDARGKMETVCRE
jgi:hypothetical protein